MFALWFFSLFSALSVMTSAAMMPIEIERMVRAKAEIQADNFLGYRRAVLYFRETHISYSGSVTASQLTAYAYWGDSFESQFGGMISGKQAYIWQSPPFFSAEKYILARKLGYSFTVGINRGGTLWAQRGDYVRNTGIIL
ncbi:type IV pilus biogenesis protein PilM, partial [Alcanivorax sp.]|uniref:type IV pilus biogenesis protein PilM n=1 Tax=Alcanivorax sp. TaxID=1872427 RepID=UPI00258E9553